MPFFVEVSLAPGSAKNVTVCPLRLSCSSVEPWNFTYGRFVFSASATLMHGAAFVHSVPVPFGSTYATFASSPHAPSGKHALDGQSVCATQPWHVLLAAQTGVCPSQASWLSGVHWTHVPCGNSHTPVGSVQSALALHRVSASGGCCCRHSASSGCAAQNRGLRGSAKI